MFPAGASLVFPRRRKTRLDAIRWSLIVFRETGPGGDLRPGPYWLSARRINYYCVHTMSNASSYKLPSVEFFAFSAKNSEVNQAVFSIVLFMDALHIKCSSFPLTSTIIHGRRTNAPPPRCCCCVVRCYLLLSDSFCVNYNCNDAALHNMSVLINSATFAFSLHIYDNFYHAIIYTVRQSYNSMTYDCDLLAFIKCFI